MISLPDVNVWLALAIDVHPHHGQAARWLEQFTRDQLVFCRITEMGLLRLLTNSKVMGGAPLSPSGAWKVRDQFLDDPRVGFLKEPPGFEKHWRDSTRSGHGVSFWTDAYLISLCTAAGCTLVTFERALSRRKGARTRLLFGVDESSGRSD